MLVYPEFDRVALELGPLKIHWYGIMYLAAFAAGWWLARVRARRPWSPIAPGKVDDLVFYVMLGVIVGGRLGYLLFYGWGHMAEDPLYPVKIWQGGMSFHGGLLGVLAALWYFARKQGLRYFAVVDFVAPLAPFGLGLGRIGNFINGELWGKPTDLPWGFRVNDSVFPGAVPGPEVLHPSMLYEALLEGLVLFVVLWIYSSKPRPVKAVSGMFALLYGIFRTAVEFVRVPDAHLDYLAFGWLTMGQVLSIPLIVVGILLLAQAYRDAGDAGDASDAGGDRDDRPAEAKGS